LRRFSIPNPFASGYVSEFPDYVIPIEKASFAQDVFAPNGMVRQRRGWSYVNPSVTTVGSTSVAPVFSASSRTKFAFGDVTRTLGFSNLSPTNTDIFLCDSSLAGNGKVLYNANSHSSGSGVYLPRCVYEGEVIMCHTSGERPLLRYSGASNDFSSSTAVSIGMPVGSFKVSTSWSSSPLTVAATRGAYAWFRPPNGSGGFAKQPALCDRIVSDGTLGGSSADYVVENLRNTNAAATATANALFSISPIGVTWPAVIVQEGTASVISGDTVTTDGIDPTATVYLTTNATDPGGDAVAVEGTSGTGPYEIATITATTTTAVTTHYNITSGLATNRYFILRRCPFRDAAVHKESLWGAGVKEFPSTVYVWPPTQNLGIPPQSATPYFVTNNAGYSSASVTGFLTENDFTLFSFDVPSKFGTTPIEALLSTDGPLLVLKTDSVYGVYGTYTPTERDTGGGLEVTKIADWGGCIDLRSAISGEDGVYWAGADGVFTWRGGQIVDLTAGIVQREWRSLMRGYQSGTSTVSCGVAESRYLIVSATGLDSTKTADAMIGPDSGPPASRTLVYDIATSSWLGRMSNFSPTHMWNATVEDGGAATLGSLNSGSRIVDVSTSYVPDSTSASDGDSTYPTMKLWSSTSLAQAEGVEGEARLCDIMVHTNIYDSATPTSSLSLTSLTGGGLDSDPNSTKSLSPVVATTVDRVDRHKRMVNQSGRLHQIRLEMDTTDADNKKSEVAEIVLSFRDSRRGT
jgi:hypothetical protein